MKRIFGILLSLVIALLLFVSMPSPANAQSEKGMYQEQMSDSGQRDNWNNRGHWNKREQFHTPFMWKMHHLDNTSLALASLYKVGVDVILSILFITFFSKFIMTIFSRMTVHPLKNGYVGFTFLIIFPLISAILLGLIWLGIAGFLTYGLIFLTGLFLTKVFIGWAILRRLEEGYVLDWKAGLAGPMVVFILLVIPVLGWITLAVIMSVATGSLLKEILPHFGKHRLEHKEKK
jgi:hypothetical protein